MNTAMSMYKFKKPRINPDTIPGRKDLVDFFKRKKIEQYLEIFPKTVNFAYFKTMNEDDFTEYGISSKTDMKVLTDALQQAQLEEEAEDNEVTIYLLFIERRSFLKMFSRRRATIK